MPKSSSPKSYLVLGHSVAPATNEIAFGNTVTRIEPKSMEVLVYLFENAGVVKSREQIQDAIWGDVVVGDDSLTNAIIKIRKAFGDDARAPKVIETIPKRGYRLIAEVEEAQGDVLARSRTPLALVVVVLVGLLGVLAWATRLDPVIPQLTERQNNRTRIAVASFLNLSGDPNQDYLAQGVEQTILAGLAAIPQIAAMHTPVIGETIDYLLEGSVQRSGDFIRIDTRLMDATTNTVLAAERYDRAFSDLMAITTEIELTIVTALALEIEQANLTSQARGFTDSIEAYDLFLQARMALLPRDPAGNARARSLYQRAIARDPRFARAYGGLALVYAASYRNGWASDGDEALAKALSMAQTALEIQPNLPEQYWVIGYVHTQQQRLVDAERALSSALQLDPNYADALALQGGIQTYAGRPDKTLLLLREAMHLEPAAGYLYFLLLGRAYYFLEDCDQALINLQEAATRNPSNIETRLYLAGCLVRVGDMADAEWEAEEVLGLDPDFTLATFFLTYPMIDSDQIEMLTRDLNLAGIY